MAELNHLAQIHQGPQVSYGFPNYYGSSSIGPCPLSYPTQAMVGSQNDGMVHGFATGQTPGGFGGGMGSGMGGLFLPVQRHLKAVIGVPRHPLQRRRTMQTAKQNAKPRLRKGARSGRMEPARPRGSDLQAGRSWHGGPVEGGVAGRKKGGGGPERSP